MKYSYSEVKNFIEIESDSGCILISGSYNNCKEKLKIKCKCGEIFEASFDKFINKNKRQCNACGKFECKKFDYEYIKSYIESKNLCLLSERNEYVDLKSILKIQCDCGEIFYASFYNFKYNKKHTCKKCSVNRIKKSKKLDYEYVENYINTYSNCILVSNNYINNRSLLEIKCGCGNIFKTSFDNFSNHNKKKCNECTKKESITRMSKKHEKFFNEVFDLVGNEYEVIDEYINSYTKIKIKHNVCGNIYNTAPHLFLTGTRCPYCSESKGETKIRYFLEKNKINFIKQYVFEDLIGLGNGYLRFDFAVFDDYNNLKFLIEFQGKQHYKHIAGMMSYENFIKLQKHDNLKINYCLKNNIELIHISYLNFNDIDNILYKIII